MGTMTAEITTNADATATRVALPAEPGPGMAARSAPVPPSTDAVERVAPGVR